MKRKSNMKMVLFTFWQLYIKYKRWTNRRELKSAVSDGTQIRIGVDAEKVWCKTLDQKDF